MDASVISLGPAAETLILVGLACLAALVFTAIYVASRPKYRVRGGEAVEPYLSGEGPEVVRRPEAPSPTLFWGLIIGYMRRAYRYLREELHSGRLSDWAAYMSSWMGFLTIVALIVIFYALIWGWP